MPEKLGALLVRKKLVTPAQVEEALKLQMIYGGKLGTNLIELGYLGIDALGKALAEQTRFPLATVAQFEAVSKNTLALLRKDVAAKHCCFPLRQEGRKLWVAMANPYEIGDVDAVKYATGGPVIPLIAPELRLVFYIERRYGMPRKERYLRFNDEGTPLRAATAAAPTPRKAYLDADEVMNNPLPETPAAGTGPGMELKPLKQGEYLTSEEDDIYMAAGGTFGGNALHPPSKASAPKGSTSPHVKGFAGAPPRPSPPAPRIVSSLQPPAEEPPAEAELEEIVPEELPELEPESVAAEAEPEPEPEPAPEAAPPPAPPPPADDGWSATPQAAEPALESEQPAQAEAPPSLADDGWSTTPEAAEPEPEPAPAESPPPPADDGWSAAPQTAEPAPEPEVTPPQTAEEPSVPPPGLLLVEQAIGRAPERDKVAEALLWFCEGRFRRALLFKMKKGELRGWLGFGPGIDKELLSRLALPASEDSALKRGIDAGQPLAIAQPNQPADQRLFASLGGAAPTEALVASVAHKERVLLVLYGDRGLEPLQPTAVDDAVRAINATARAFERLVQQHKRIED